ncbi:MAG: DUF983 domain-containing protein [Asticcacaulis sp.]
MTGQTQGGGGVSFLAAAAGRCPICGKGKLFRSFLKVASSCSNCGTSFKAADTGDGPVVFVLLITGFVTCFAMLYAFLAFAWPAWMHLVVWPAFACILSLGLMQPLKGLMVAAQLKNHVRD